MTLNYVCDWNMHSLFLLIIFLHVQNYILNKHIAFTLILIHIVEYRKSHEHCVWRIERGAFICACQLILYQLNRLPTARWLRMQGSTIVNLGIDFPNRRDWEQLNASGCFGMIIKRLVEFQARILFCFNNSEVKKL